MDDRFCDLDTTLAEFERPPAGWDDAPTEKVVYERRSCGLVRICVTRVTTTEPEVRSYGMASSK